MATSQTQASQVAIIRKTLSELPAPSDYAPVTEAIARSTELGEAEITKTLSGLVSMPQSTTVFANPPLHAANVDCNGTSIELQIRSFSIRGLLSESEIVAGNVTPAYLIFVGLFGRLPQRDDVVDEELLIQSLIDKKFYQIAHTKQHGISGIKPISFHVAEFMKTFSQAGPEIAIQHIAMLHKAAYSKKQRQPRGFDDHRNSGYFLIRKIHVHMMNVAVGGMSTYMRYLLDDSPNLSEQELAEETCNFIEQHKEEGKTAFETCYSLLLGRKANDVEAKILERMGIIQTHHGSAASNVVARYMSTLHAVTISDFFNASQMILDGKRHFGAIHDMTAFIKELEEIPEGDQVRIVREKVMMGGLPTFGHPEISAAGRGNQIQQDPRAAIYLSPFFDAIDQKSLSLSNRQLERLKIVQRIYQIAFIEGLTKPDQEDRPPLRLTPNTDFGAWCVQEGLGVDDPDRTLLTYIFRGFGWIMDAREQLQQRIMRPVVAPHPDIIPAVDNDPTVPDQVVNVHNRLAEDEAFSPSG
ncbi:hypothetical protein CMK22_10580 [Candidatus Poribacteria bacterium]|nr:hypothetical protein [Candidatus Poribacteria bacterium]